MAHHRPAIRPSLSGSRASTRKTVTIQAPAYGRSSSSSVQDESETLVTVLEPPSLPIEKTISIKTTELRASDIDDGKHKAKKTRRLSSFFGKRRNVMPSVAAAA